MTHSTTIKNRGYRKLLIYLGVACYAILWHYFTLVAPPELFTVNEVSAITEAHIAQHIPEQAFPPTELYYSTRLPDDWHRSNRTHNDYWYRLNYRAHPSQLDIARAWSVYVPAVTHNMVIYLNGKWIGQTGEFTPPTPRYHNAPQIFHFDASLLNHTNNQLDIRVAAGHHSQGLLGAIYVAPTHLLMKEHRFKHFIRVTLVEWMTLCMTLLAFISLVFFLYRPKDKIYGVFAIELALWGLHNLNLLVHQIPISTKHWEAFTMATLVWTVITMVLFNHRYFNERIYWVERFLWGFAISAFLLFIFPSNGLVLSLGYAIWDSVLVILGVYAISFLLHHFHHKPDLDTLLMILSGFPILAFGLHDILVVNHYLDKQDGLIIQYSCVLHYSYLVGLSSAAL